jgi:hypothetical protein
MCDEIVATMEKMTKVMVMIMIRSKNIRTGSMIRDDVLSNVIFSFFFIVAKKKSPGNAL